MGKIKTKLVKRTAETLINKEINFSEHFDENKRILGRNMPSKKIRNQIAGYLARIKTQQKQKTRKITG